MRDGVRRLVAVGMSLVIVAACAKSAPDPVVDGWPIGTPVDCAAAVDCGGWLAVAQARLDVRDPGHAEVVKAILHNEGTLVAPDGGLQIFTRSGGCCSVAVFELADGTVEAVGDGMPGISQTVEAIDFGP